MYMFPLDEVNPSLSQARIAVSVTNSLPQSEHERLDIMHQLIYGDALGGELHLAQLKRPPQRIVDLGFGSGYWMMEAATKYPNAECIGLDLVPPVANIAHPPEKAVFLTPTDFTAPAAWPIKDGSVDLVHMAQLCGSVPDWVDLYSKAYRSLQPGTGQIEHIEIDWTPRTTEPQLPQKATPLWDWWWYTKDASRRARRPLEYREDTGDLLEHAGFMDVSHRQIRIPLSLVISRDDRDYKLYYGYHMAMGCKDCNSFHALSMSFLTRYSPGMSPAQAAHICSAALAVVQMQSLPLYIYL